MKFQMAKNSLFAILLRSPWWVSFLPALLLAGTSFALLPDPYKVVGALSGLPFVAIGVVAFGRQWHLPSARRIEETQQALATMAWPAFSALLVQAFERDGHTVTRRQADGCDFELVRRGRRMVVSARRWKSARPGLEVLRSLQAARDAAEAEDALCISLAPLTDNARPYAVEHGIQLWQPADLAHALRGLPLTPGGR